MSTPAFAVIALFTLAPIGLSTAMSFFSVTIAGRGLKFDWVGVDNYTEVLSSRASGDALMFTVVFTAVSVVVQLVIGTAIALLLDEMARGRAAVLALLLLPYSMITVIAAQLWAYIANGVYGVGNYLLMLVGFVQEPVNFLGSTQGAFAVAVTADSWKTIPFVTLIALGGLRMIDRGVYEAATVDGAGWLTRTLRITLPLLTGSLLTAAVFRILQAFGIFDMIFVLTQGGPGTSTVTVSMLAYNAIFQDLNIGRSATITTLATLIIIMIALLFLRAFRRQAAEGNQL